MTEPTIPEALKELMDEADDAHERYIRIPEEAQRVKYFAADAALVAAIAEIVRERDEAQKHCMALNEVSEENVALRAERDALRDDAARLRKWLWLAHGHAKGHFAALYGDDGEMQCSACSIDFKRMSTEDLSRFLDAARTQEPTP